ncbi:Uncharacterized protein TCM_001558 [Theobroma cacao]|uniref:Uncharacterized protein n=1 Tax=Theobroma cacao TaxID=3641 RepID=A0A061DKR5_THECC|nr:Uncharacterized protein TCM_001558 [Theobroma cacao]
MFLRTFWVVAFIMDHNNHLHILTCLSAQSLMISSSLVLNGSLANDPNARLFGAACPRLDDVHPKAPLIIGLRCMQLAIMHLVSACSFGVWAFGVHDHVQYLVYSFLVLLLLVHGPGVPSLPIHVALQSLYGSALLVQLDFANVLSVKKPPIDGGLMLVVDGPKVDMCPYGMCGTSVCYWSEPFIKLYKSRDHGQ